jgi:hypothetical protein
MNQKQRKEWDDIVNESVISLADPSDTDMHETSQMFVDVNKYILKLERELQNIKGGRKIAAILKSKVSA